MQQIVIRPSILKFHYHYGIGFFQKHMDRTTLKNSYLKENLPNNFILIYISHITMIISFLYIYSQLTQKK